MAIIWASPAIYLRDHVCVDVRLDSDGGITQSIVAGRPLAEDLTYDNDAEVEALIVALQTALNKKRSGGAK